MNGIDVRRNESGNRAGPIFAYGAAAAMTPYLLIKVSWVVGALFGSLPVGEGFSVVGWVLLNAVTIVMAATGIVLGLALARPWGRRIPAVPLLSCAWIGTGFLVPMLPYMLVSSLLGGSDDATDGGGPTMPMWEGVLIGVSFAGLAVGLAVALPIYVRERWPAAFRGRVGLGSEVLRAQGRQLGTSGAVAITVTGVLGLLQLYWATGGTLGLDQPELGDLDWRVLTGNAAFWAFAGAGSVWSLNGERASRLPLWIPVTVAWVASGFLFAWSCWKLPLAGYLAVASDEANLWPENLAVAAAHAAVSIFAGATMLAIILRTYRTRRGNGTAHDLVDSRF